MPFQDQINFLELLLKGIFIGVVVSAPMGPVGVLCVQRTLNKGRRYGFVTGVGAAVSDIIYAMLTGFGMSLVMDLITNAQYRFHLQIFGSILLFLFGLYCFRSNPTKNIHVSGKKGTLVQNGITAFAVTISNPLIIFLFMACYAQAAFVIPDHPVEMSLGYASIFCGALLWWWGLTWLIDKVREKFSDKSIITINRLIGSIVMVLSAIMFVGTAFNLYSIY